MDDSAIKRAECFHTYGNEFYSWFVLILSEAGYTSIAQYMFEESKSWPLKNAVT